MKKSRAILEMGMGNDLHGSDYTKAASRAVQDALHHSSLNFIKSLGIDRSRLHLNVTIGVQKPEKVDTEAVKTALPLGIVSIVVVKGGLDIPDESDKDPAVIANAAIDVLVKI